MLERDATKRLTGRVEIDDAYLGGERAGGKRGRGAPGKTPFVVAVETTAEGKPVRLKLRRVTSFCTTAISGFAKRSLDPTCSVVSDGLQCFGGVANAGCAPSRQDQIRTEGRPQAHMSESSDEKSQVPLDPRLLDILVCLLTKGPRRLANEARNLGQ